MAEFPCHATTIVNYVPRKKNFKKTTKKDREKGKPGREKGKPGRETGSQAGRRAARQRDGQPDAQTVRDRWTDSHLCYTIKAMFTE